MTKTGRGGFNTPLVLAVLLVAASPATGWVWRTEAKTLPMKTKEVPSASSGSGRGGVASRSGRGRGR